MLVAEDKLLPDLMLFNEKPAKIVALAACIVTLITAIYQIACNCKKARIRGAKRRKEKEAKQMKHRPVF